MTDLQSLRELAQKATPGPWEATEHGNIRANGRIFADVMYRFTPEQDAANIGLIAACSPDRILAILDVCEAAQDMRDCVDQPQWTRLHDALARLRGAK